MPIDISRLLAQLNNTGIQNKNTPLYQFLSELIRTLRGLNTDVNNINTSSSVVDTIINQTIQSIDFSSDSDGGGDSLPVPGPAGTIGPQGNDGTVGPIGIPGADGLDGDIFVIPGAAGTQGPQGISGNDGNKGSPGEDGLDGDFFAIPGSQGPQGNPGNTGSQGPQGVSFLPEDGLDGDSGPPGIQGIQGIQGNTGAQGPIGVSIYPNDGLDGDSLVIPGSTGPQGITGSQGPLGVSIYPSDGLDGDSYPVIPGPQGLTGNTGAGGPVGVNVLVSDGLDADMLPIIPGPQGIQGARGNDGILGMPGADGLDADVLQVFTDPLFLAKLNAINTFIQSQIISVHRVSGANATVIVFKDDVTGVQTPAFGLQLRYNTNTVDIAAIAFEVGNTGTNNESQIGLFTQNTVAALTRQFTVGSLGDWLFGPNQHIMDSSGTPTIASGFGTGATIAGNDYAFVITNGTGVQSGGTINFGHTFNNAPVVIAYFNGGVGVALTITTTSVNIAYVLGDVTGKQIFVLVRGY